MGPSTLKYSVKGKDFIHLCGTIDIHGILFENYFCPVFSVSFSNAFLKLAFMSLSSVSLEHTSTGVDTYPPKGKKVLEIAVCAALSAFLAILIHNSMCIEPLPWEKNSS